MLEEVFKAGKYFCSSGEIFSRANYRGGLMPIDKARKLRPSKAKNGYLIYAFVDLTGNVFYSTGHKAVWNFYNGPVPIGLQLNHKDFNKENNTLENLELVTPSENKEHAKAGGRYVFKDRERNSKGRFV